MPPNSKTRSNSAKLSPLSIVWMIWKWRLMILVGCLFPAGAGFYYVRRMPSVYKADALIVVDSQKIPEKFVSATVQAELNDTLGPITQQALSTARLQSIIEEFNLYPKARVAQPLEDVIAGFRNSLPLTLEHGLGGGRPGAFRIAYEGPDPKIVAAVVNRVAGLFVQENLNTRAQRAEGTSQFLEAQLKEAKASLDDQENRLSQFKLQWSGELPQQETALMGTLSRLNTELAGNQDAVNRAQQNNI